jgi:hypothetical protein
MQAKAKHLESKFNPKWAVTHNERWFWNEWKILEGFSSATIHVAPAS